MKGGIPQKGKKTNGRGEAKRRRRNLNKRGHQARVGMLGFSGRK